MAWYSQHQIRFRGRLVQFTLRYGCLEGAGLPRVVKGKPLDFSVDSRDWIHLKRLIEKNQRIQNEVRDIAASL